MVMTKADLLVYALGQHPALQLLSFFLPVFDMHKLDRCILMRSFNQDNLELAVRFAADKTFVFAGLGTQELVSPCRLCS